MTVRTPADKTKVFAILIAALTVTSLAGCSGESETPEATEGTPGGGGSSSEDTEGDDVDCLIGDWTATESGLESWYSSFVSVDDVEVTSVTGEVLLSFSESDFIYSTREITVTMSIADQVATTRMTGGVAGTYTAEPEGIMTTRIDSSDLGGTAEVSGLVFSTEELGIDLSGAGAFVGYECTGDKLLLETQSAGAGTATIELEPARE
jgi:hypothetical protein